MIGRSTRTIDRNTVPVTGFARAVKQATELSVGKQRFMFGTLAIDTLVFQLPLYEWAGGNAAKIAAYHAAQDAENRKRCHIKHHEEWYRSSWGDYIERPTDTCEGCPYCQKEEAEYYG